MPSPASPLRYGHRLGSSLSFYRVVRPRCCTLHSPAQIPRGDPRLPTGPNSCIPVFRSAAVCGTGNSAFNFGGVANKREQINTLTAFLDLGQVYGSEEQLALDLRNLTSDGGLLRVNDKFKDNGRELLPFSPMLPEMCATRKNITKDSNAQEVPCFLGGWHLYVLYIYTTLYISMSISVCISLALSLYIYILDFYLYKSVFIAISLALSLSVRLVSITIIAGKPLVDSRLVLCQYDCVGLVSCFQVTCVSMRTLPWRPSTPCSCENTTVWRANSR